MIVLARYLPAAVCASAAAYLAAKGVEGWGWFLLVAVLLT
jgi:hypothetical protein